MHSVWFSTNLTDGGPDFQIFSFPASELLFLLQFYLTLTLSQLIFLMFVKQLRVQLGYHLL